MQRIRQAMSTLWGALCRETTHARVRAGCRLSVAVAVTTPFFLTIPLRWVSGWLLTPAYQHWWAQHGVPAHGRMATLREAAHWLSFIPPVHLALAVWEIGLIWRSRHDDGTYWSPAFVSAMAITPLLWWGAVALLLMGGPIGMVSIWFCAALMMPYAIMRTWMDITVAGMLDSTQLATRITTCPASIPS
jgi:hypothetical protein